MNKFNPFYILLFSFCLFLYSVIELRISNDNLLIMEEQNKQFMNIANRYNSLQIGWGKDQDTKKRCENILKSSNIQNAKIIINETIIKIKISDASLNSLNKFINKLLNETIVILNFSLTKNSLDLEVRL